MRAVHAVCRRPLCLTGLDLPSLRACGIDLDSFIQRLLRYVCDSIAFLRGYMTAGKRAACIEKWGP
ncbi:protein of unknown function [Candidatus Methylomirabilis oxygeniifera]|uniref:Uncharacterized protein n=1 Tax=Methylomirabilis oxygeniifera TaxID=671143 RepID=D5MES5_METO1|nr:protein of unknown function [Candidatus Methylomirabilis oxyfera]